VTGEDCSKLVDLCKRAACRLLVNPIELATSVSASFFMCHTTCSTEIVVQSSQTKIIAKVVVH
jgi:hypothetical protein